MAQFHRFTAADGSEVEFEITGDGDGGGGQLEAALGSLSAMATAITSRIKDMEEGTAPEETEVSFGLTATADGALAVSAGFGNAHLHVVMRFSADRVGGIGPLAEDL